MEIEDLSRNTLNIYIREFITNNESMVGAIAEIIGNNLRNHLDSESSNFQYTILGQRIPSPDQES